MSRIPFLEAFSDITSKYSKIPKSDFLECATYPIIDQGRGQIAGYFEDKSFASDMGEVVVFGDHTRAVKFTQGPFALGADGTKVLLPRESMLPRYLYRWLQAQDIPNLGYSRHFKLLKDLSVPAPALEEQRRIAEILDEVDALRAKRREAIAHLDTLSQSIFFEMFGQLSDVRWALLKETIRAGDRINYGVVQPGSNVNQGIPLVRAGDFSGGIVRTSNLKMIDPSVESKYARSRLTGDEVLVCCVGSVGEVALAHDSLTGANIARAVARIPLSSEFDRRFVAEFIRSDRAQRYFKQETRTVSQPTLNIKELGNLPIPVLPLKLQQEFASHVIAVEGLKTVQLAQLAELDALFLSLQNRVFRGNSDGLYKC